MKSNLFYNILLTTLNVLFPVLSFPYAAHILGPVGIGKVQFILSFAQYFAIIASIGIPVYGIREVAKNRDEPERLAQVFSELVIISFISGFILSIAYLAILFSSSFFSGDEYLYLPAVLLIIFNFTSIDWFYSGIGNFKVIAIRSLLIKALALCFLYLFIKKPQDYHLYLWLSMFSMLGNNFLNLLLLKGKVAFTTKAVNIKRHFRPMIYIFSTSVAASMYTVLDTVLLGFLSSNAAVGFYTAAVKLCRIVLPFISALGAVLLPEITKRINKGGITNASDLLDKSFNYIIFFSVPISAIFLLLAHELIEAFSGTQFAPAELSMKILSALPLLIGLGYFFAFQLLIPSGRDREMLFCVTAGIISCLVLNAVLVPRYMHNGAAAATVISELVVTSAYYFYIRKLYNFRLNYPIIIKAILCSLLFIPIIYLMRGQGLGGIPFLIITGLVCAIVYSLSQWLIFKNILVNDLLIQFWKG